MRLDLPRVAERIREIAAEELVPRFARLDPEEIADKGVGDLVTAADYAMERRFGEALPELLPGSVVIGEEAVAGNQDLLDLLHGPDPVWVVDPRTRSVTVHTAGGIVNLGDGETLAAPDLLPGWSCRVGELFPG